MLLFSFHQNLSPMAVIARHCNNQEELRASPCEEGATGVSPVEYNGSNPNDLKKAQHICRYAAIVSIPEECVTIHNDIASIMVKVLIEAIPLWIVTSLRSSQ